MSDGNLSAGPALIQINVFQFSKSDLMTLPAADRELMIRSGHALNTLGVWSKSLALTVNHRTKDEVLDSFNAAQAQIIIRSLIGALVETWRWLKRKDTYEHIRDYYASELPKDSAVAYSSLGQKFDGSGILSRARDAFSFHFPKSSALQTAFDSVPDDQDFNWYMAAENTNSLYFGCEAVIGYGVQSLAAKEIEGRMGMVRVVHEMIDAANAMSDFLGGLLSVIIKRYLDDRPRSTFAVEGSPGPKFGLPFLLDRVFGPEQPNN